MKKGRQIVVPEDVYERLASARARKAKLAELETLLSGRLNHFK